eukprot:scaffold27604_cov141-Isochrysis_galbana.AAC.1
MNRTDTDIRDHQTEHQSVHTSIVRPCTSGAPTRKLRAAKGQLRIEGRHRQGCGGRPSISFLLGVMLLTARVAGGGLRPQARTSSPSEQATRQADCGLLSPEDPSRYEE